MTQYSLTASASRNPGPRDYTRNTLITLGYLSGGLCYRPGCGEPVVREVDGEPYVIVEVAHIRGAKRGSARYDEQMTNGQRRHISNLLLLCDPDHDIVDKDEQTYTITTLHRWKTQREANPREALLRLHKVSPAGLRKIVADGLEGHDAKLMAALNRLQTRDKEAANLMRSLVDELTEAYAARRRQTLDPDVVYRFSRSVETLAGMSGVLDAFTTAVRKMPSQRRAY